MPRSVEAVKQRYVDHSLSSQAFGDAGMRAYVTSDVTVKMLKDHLNLESSPTVINSAQNNMILNTRSKIFQWIECKRIFSAYTLKFRVQI